MRKIATAVTVVFLVFLFVSSVEARSGCCSHHGGVCGCGCCDGTSLSATCAPYYPSCNSTPSRVPSAPSKPSCPSSSYYDSALGTCICSTGFASYENTCVRIPEYAHTSTSKADAWECDEGYRESGNSCILKKDCEGASFQTTITRIIDGDTIEYSCEDKKYKVRVIGIDTPETVDPSEPVGCFGKEASDKMTELVLNKSVGLTKGSGSDNKDKYDRLLRYVFVGNIDIGAKMIQDGYAFSYKEYPHEKLEEYNQLEEKARSESIGLWDTKACNYQQPKTINTNSSVENKNITEKTNSSNESFFQKLFKWIFGTN